MIPFKPSDDLLSMLIPVVVMLLLLAGIAFALLTLARRRGALLPGAARRMRVVERLVLSRRSALLLVECDGRLLLLGQSGEQLSLLESRRAE